MRWIRANFTLFGVATIITLLLAAGTIWILLAVHNYRLENIQVRALTAEDHAGCADKPRGTQEMENERLKCFRTTYGNTPFRIDR